MQPLLDAIAGMKSKSGTRLRSRVAPRHGAARCSPSAPKDLRNSDRMIANVGQGGLSLPDRDYYLKTDPACARDARRVRGPRGEDARARRRRHRVGARAFGERDPRVETGLAKNSSRTFAASRSCRVVSLPAVRLAARDDAVVRLERRLPQGRVPLDSLNIGHPMFLRNLEAAHRRTPLADLRRTCAGRCSTTLSPTLSEEAFVQENFAFSSRMTDARRCSRWKRCCAPPTARRPAGRGCASRNASRPPRASALTLVTNLEAALGDQLWCSAG